MLNWIDYNESFHLSFNVYDLVEKLLVETGMQISLPTSFTLPYIMCPSPSFESDKDTLCDHLQEGMSNR